MIKNKAESEVFARLAAQAEIYLAILPWLNDFEEDEFIAPDFTSMEALTLVSTTMPAGTNGPNYEDVKRDCGFKNISIRNRVIESSSDNVTFLDAEDKALYARYAVDGFGVIVAFHELIGHGSGKCFTEKSNGQYNFDRDNPPINPLTRQVVKTWYKNGQTAKSIFGSSYEECRAECVALYLALQSESMELFTYADEEKDDVVFVGFLYILRAGLIGLEAWNPITKTWASAHARARFAILKHLLTVAEPAISLKFEKENSPDTDVRLKLDRTKLQSHVLPAIKDLVMRLHIHQCIADRVGGVELYDRLSEVDEKMKSVREIVLKHKSPRKQFVQANTVIVDGKVQLREYEESAAGMIQSWAERDV